MNISSTIKSNEITLDNISALFLMLKNNMNNYVISNVSPATAYKYKGNLIGLLKNEFFVPENLLYITMLVNGYFDSSNYDGKATQFYTINQNTMQYHLNLIFDQ